jgi:hypothetical protein
MSQDDGSSDEVGTVGEEAAKLFGALSDWAKDQVGGAEGHLDTGAPACAYCPICKTVHVLRQASPEVRTQLTTAATSLIQAFAGMMATPVPGERARGGVEHIDLDDDPSGPGDDTAGWPDETDPEEGDR